MKTTHNPKLDFKDQYDKLIAVLSAYKSQPTITENDVADIRERIQILIAILTERCIRVKGDDMRITYAHKFSQFTTPMKDVVEILKQQKLPALALEILNSFIELSKCMAEKIIFPETYSQYMFSVRLPPLIVLKQDRAHLHFMLNDFKSAETGYLDALDEIERCKKKFANASRDFSAKNTPVFNNRREEMVPYLRVAVSYHFYVDMVKAGIKQNNMEKAIKYTFELAALYQIADLKNKEPIAQELVEIYKILAIKDHFSQRYLREIMWCEFGLELIDEILNDFEPYENIPLYQHLIKKAENNEELLQDRLEDTYKLVARSNFEILATFFSAERLPIELKMTSNDIVTILTLPEDLLETFSLALNKFHLNYDDGILDYGPNQLLIRLDVSEDILKQFLNYLTKQLTKKEASSTAASHIAQKSANDNSAFNSAFDNLNLTREQEKKDKLERHQANVEARASSGKEETEESAKDVDGSTESSAKTSETKIDWNKEETQDLFAKKFAAKEMYEVRGGKYMLTFAFFGNTALDSDENAGIKARYQSIAELGRVVPHKKPGKNKQKRQGFEFFDDDDLAKKYPDHICKLRAKGPGIGDTRLLGREFDRGKLKITHTDGREEVVTCQAIILDEFAEKVHKSKKNL